jgi:hypothetical protein
MAVSAVPILMTFNVESELDFCGLYRGTLDAEGGHQPDSDVRTRVPLQW